MRTRAKSLSEVERFNPDFNNGLTAEQVNKRIEEGLVNKTKMVVGKTTWEIIRSNVLTFFNILLFTIAGFMIYANVNDGDPNTKWFSGIFFVVILLSNIIIGLYEDIHAKHLMKKMRLITTQKITVIRDGKEVKIDPSEVVLDDILSLSGNDQIVSDGVILDGNVFINESLLTGESVNVSKTVGDTVYSGTYVVSGHCHVKVEKVGAENYIETIASKAKSVKRNPSHILRSLKVLFRILGMIVIFGFLSITLTYVILGSFNTKEDFIRIIGPLSGQFVAMIPAGLNLLTSMALASGVVSLYRKNANVQDLFSIEMLARTDVLCVDKTGTITDGTMEVVEVVPLNIIGSAINEEDINLVVSNILKATADNNMTAEALKNYFKLFNELEVTKALPFNSDNKYSGVTFSTGLTYLLGAAEFLDIELKQEVLAQSEKYTSKGNRVLLLAKGNGIINEGKYEGKLTPLAFIVLQDHIKENAKKTFTWFKENGVAIKVISGDNAITVSEIAKQAGIEGAEAYISLEGKSLDEVREIATQYSVFGRVTPEQKEVIVESLKNSGKTVAMTGDGVNDILALKCADCSIAMNSGSPAAKNVSHVVLMNNDFATMPDIVAEGRRVINNLQRTGSLFLSKTFFAIVMSVVFWIVSLSTRNQFSYPFSTNNLLIWETLGIGLSAFFVSLEPNSAPIKRGFLRNIMRKAVPSVIVILSAIFVSYFLLFLNEKGFLYTGVSEFGYSTFNSNLGRYGATAIAVMSFSFLSLLNLYIICRPLTKYRGAVVISASIIAVIIYVIVAFRASPRNILGLDFTKITYENILVTIGIFISITAVRMFISTMHAIRKEYKNKNDQN